MVRVFQCDICGRCYPFPENYHDINRISFRQANHNTQHELKYRNICPVCFKAFEKLVEERKQKEE